MGSKDDHAAKTEKTQVKTGGGRSGASGPSATPPTEIPTAPLYPDWGAPLRAFYGPGAGVPSPPPPQAYFPPPAMSASPSGHHHPYVWGGQPMFPAYGAPIMYSHGGVYPHSGPAYSQPVVAMEAKDQGSAKKKAKGVEENPVVDSVAGKHRNGGKPSSGSEDEDSSHSEYEYSSEERDAEIGKARGFSEAAQRISEASPHAIPVNPIYSSGKTTSKLPVLAPGRAVLPGRPLSPNQAPSAAQRPVMPEIQWVQQDERELKRQKRKQSNRESARRSRLKKQQECEDLAKKVDQLNNENGVLRREIDQLSKDCKDLQEENASLMEELSRV